MLADQVAQVRRFNRLVTQRVGALDDHFLGRDRPLGASRLLYEIGRQGAELRELRRRLGLDAGYVSRLAKALAREGLVRLGQGGGDQRVRKARLTALGQREIQEMNARSDEPVEAVVVRSGQEPVVVNLDIAEANEFPVPFHPAATGR